MRLSQIWKMPKTKSISEWYLSMPNKVYPIITQFIHILYIYIYIYLIHVLLPLIPCFTAGITNEWHDSIMNCFCSGQRECFGGGGGGINYFSEHTLVDANVIF